MIYQHILQVQKLVRRLQKVWETNFPILEDGDFQNITYGKLQVNLIAYERNYINRYNKEENKKPIAYNVLPIEKKDFLEEANSKEMALINRGVRQIMK